MSFNLLLESAVIIVYVAWLLYGMLWGMIEGTRDD